jgi:hypothetical protein
MNQKKYFHESLSPRIYSSNLDNKNVKKSFTYLMMTYQHWHLNLFTVNIKMLLKE